MAIASNSFPGVYVTVKDNSFIPEITSRFLPGLIGVAEKGPFNVATPIRSIREFRQTFGKSLDGSYLANAVAAVTQISDGATVVRVGREYSDVVANGSGSEGTYEVFTPNANLFSINDYVRIAQAGKATTVNARVEAVNDSSLTLVSVGSEAVPLADTYTAAEIGSSPVSGAANEAESFLYSTTWGSQLEVLGNVVGDKNAFTFTVDGDVQAQSITSITRSSTVATTTTDSPHGLATGDKVTISGATGASAGYNGDVSITVTGSSTFTFTCDSSLPSPATGTLTYSVLVAGDLIKIEQSDRETTREARVKEIRVDGTIVLEPVGITEIGYQALPLQDSYTSGRISKAVGTAICAQLLAASPGTWANSDGAKTGLIVTVSPGSAPDTKKLLVYEDSGLVETIDNLSEDSESDNYYTTRINGKSSAITINILSSFEHPANTTNPWNLSSASKLNVAAFDGGSNGEDASSSDFIGTLNPSDDSQTGLKAFEDPDNVDINLLCAPGNTDIAVHQEIARICGVMNAFGVLDIPQGLNAREAVDWHNGSGLYSFRGKIDNYRVGCFWNWITIVDQFTGSQKIVPPSIGVLRAMAQTFDRDKPWFAAAGEFRGLIPEALSVEFNRVSPDVKDAMYGNGNSVNPILLSRGRIMVFGDRTLQRAESKLTAIHSVHLVNHIVRNLSAIGRQFIFDPNDVELLSHLRLAYSDFLDQVRAERGLEDYLLVIDDSNNTADTRNRREVVVDLSIIPTDVMERLLLNVTVRESGAELNTVSS
jgi:hypothetical protein